MIDEVQEHLREESVLENTARMNVAQVQRTVRIETALRRISERTESIASGAG